MLIGITGDSHFDETPNGRFEECIRIHDWMAEDMHTRGVELVLHGGDLYHRASTPDERRAAAQWVQKVAAFAEFIIVRGNHDKPGDVKLLERLKTVNRVTVAEDARVVYAECGVVVGCMAWPQRAGILKLAAEMAGGHLVAETLAVDALRSVLRGLGERMDGIEDRDTPKIFLAHAMARGSKTSTGQPICGSDFELGLDDIRSVGADFYALGHIHMPQEWCEHEEAASSCAVVYPGSPRRTAFGETETKGYVLYDTDTKTWERIPTPCTQMVLLEGRYNPESLSLQVDRTTVPDSILDGAEIRVRFSCDADQRVASQIAADSYSGALRAAGAVDVKMERQTNTNTTARAPEIAEADQLSDKLLALWKLRGVMPPDNRKARLLSKTAELEGLV